MALITQSGITFNDSTIQTTKFDSTMDGGKLFAVSSYPLTATWTPFFPTTITPITPTFSTFGSGVSVSGSGPYTITHSAAPSTWTQSAYSAEASSTAYAQASPNQTSTYIMFGLTTAPGASYTNINYALFFLIDGTIQIYESGTSIGTFGRYEVGDIGRVTYDGSTIRYYCDKSGTRPLRTVSVSGLSLKFEAAFYNGGALSNVYFGSCVHTNPIKKVMVQVVGGGGGGAGYCESGGAGGYSEKVIDVSAVSTVAVTVGTGGAAVAYYAAAGDGTTTSFGAYCSASGGSGANRQIAHTGGASGVGSSGDLNLYGGIGTGHGNNTSRNAVGGGGGSFFGSGNRASHSTNSQVGHSAPGAGGTGSPSVNWAGSAGAAGLVVVYSYQ